MFAACSSDELVQEQGQPQWDADGNGYMAFNVALPKVEANSTRANDVFADGRDEEFAVKNMILLLFEGTSATEADAKLAQAYNISSDQLTFGNVTAQSVTSDRVIVQKIKEIKSSNVFAFVVLNKNNVFKVDNANTLYVNGEIVDNGTTFAALQGKVAKTGHYASEFGTDANGYLMMNSPLWTTNGGGADPNGGSMHILSTVNKSNIKSTKAEAAGAPAATVYVERAVAKVTMHQSNGVTKDENEVNTLFSWETTGWLLNNTNTESYVVRNVDVYKAPNAVTSLKSYSTTVVNPWRFVGHTATDHAGSGVGANSTDSWYRPYFAKDVNYNTPGAFHTDANPDFTGRTGANVFEDHPNTNDSHPLYCAENVFDVDHQVWSETTRAIVEVTLTKEAGSSYFTLNTNGDNNFLTEEYVKTKAYNENLGAFDAICSGAYNNLCTGTVNYAASEKTIVDNKVNVWYKGITVKAGLTATEIAQIHAVYPEVTDQTTAEAKFTELSNYVVDAVADLHLTYYAGGKAYYQARIKHFGDDLTPWNTWETGTKPASGDVAKIYPDNSSNRNGDYLGRYGVLRNNWYDLTVKKVSKIGFCSPKDLEKYISDNPNTPDDELENWIAIDVNILSWAKRTQDVAF